MSTRLAGRTSEVSWQPMQPTIQQYYFVIQCPTYNSVSFRLLRTQSLEWFYNNVKSRFKRFGSAKVLKNLYRKHRLESGACFDILGTPAASWGVLGAGGREEALPGGPCAGACSPGTEKAP